MDITAHSFKRGMDPGPIDFDRVWRIVAAAGYRGSMALAYETAKGWHVAAAQEIFSAFGASDACCDRSCGSGLALHQDFGREP